MLPSAEEFFLLPGEKNKRKSPSNNILITFSNAYTESLSCETQLGDTAYDSLRVEAHTKNDDDELKTKKMGT